MNRRYSNFLRFVSFSVAPNNKLTFLAYPTNNFTRIDVTKLSNNIKDIGMDKVLLVYITDYNISSSFIRTSDNLAITTISFLEFLEDSTSINLLFNYREDKNIIFIFKDLNWLEVVYKFRKNGRPLVARDIEASDTINLTFMKFLNCIDGLIGYVINENLELVRTILHEELQGYDRLVPKNKDLSTESILLFNHNKSITIYNNIDREIDNFLN